MELNLDQGSLWTPITGANELAATETTATLSGVAPQLNAALLAQTAGRAWSLRPEAMHALMVAMQDGLQAGAALFAQDGEDEGPSRSGDTAIVNLRGVIAPSAPGLLGRLLGMGGGLEQFRAEVGEALRDSDVKRIVLNVDSPGGMVDHVPETAAFLRDVREQKPVIAVANTVAASAAYWIASQASEVVATPSGEVGSIGVYQVHQDISAALEQEGVKVTLIAAGKYKVEGNQYEALSEEAREYRQGRVNRVYEGFIDDVARGRRTSAEDVRENYGQGRTMLADEAVEAGLVDRVATLDEVLREGASGGPSVAERKRRLMELW